MEKHFNYFFPVETYIPLELINIENTDIVIEKLRYDKLKNVYTHASSIIKHNTSNYITEDDGVICASITIPYGKICEIVKQEQVISSLCGPIKMMFINQGLFTTDCIIRSKDIEGINAYIKLNEELIETQRKLVIRLYSEPLFNNFKFTEGKYKDIPIGVELEYPNFLRYQSMIIPYGLYLDNAGELVPNKKMVDKFSLKPGRMFGPCVLSDVSKLYMYYKQSYIHIPIKEEEIFEKQIDEKELYPIVEKIIPEKTVVITNKKIKVIIKLSHYMYKSLKPLLGVYLLSNCLGEEYTESIKDECPWKISEKEVEQLVMYWLLKTNGDYSYIAGIYNNPKYQKICGKMLAKYSKLTQY